MDGAVSSSGPIEVELRTAAPLVQRGDPDAGGRHAGTVD
jgi:hypothetical protein